MRLLMCYCLTHPGKLDATRRVQWQKLARLSGGDMAAIANLAFLGVNVEQKGGRCVLFARPLLAPLPATSCLRPHSMGLSCTQLLTHPVVTVFAVLHAAAARSGEGDERVVLRQGQG